MLTLRCGGERKTGDDLCGRLVSRSPARWCSLSRCDVQSLRSMPPGVVSVSSFVSVNGALEDSGHAQRRVVANVMWFCGGTIETNVERY
jgi:hypothetical protein